MTTPPTLAWLDALVTQGMFLLCLVLFARLFTYQRGSARFRRGMSCLATVVMACSAITAFHILRGDLRLPYQCWPVLVLLAVFTWSVVRSGGNLADVMRPGGWDGVERRRVERRNGRRMREARDEG
ncbi:phage holin family protein [Pseudomonas oryzihabitans]|uniref:phage holin family protein n=1 Tax=Pseudomonas oryzihabitans TaxID=47885 RepID=UPI00289DAF70|nr:phage holin family protein [Pseudomonas oryzihabitans]